MIMRKSINRQFLIKLKLILKFLVNSTFLMNKQKLLINTLLNNKTKNCFVLMLGQEFADNFKRIARFLKK